MLTETAISRVMSRILVLNIAMNYLPVGGVINPRLMKKKKAPVALRKQTTIGAAPAGLALPESDVSFISSAGIASLCEANQRPVL
ncbi:hypothetical protein [Franconibacter pulveris]|uniref:hypothetical protein n=1 Tax=Franconibacter pulveris TaxID=435910 RepID=UPI00128EDDE0|nr:hypothetical protein [Franconibacter pulveris]